MSMYEYWNCRRWGWLLVHWLIAAPKSTTINSRVKRNITIRLLLPGHSYLDNYRGSFENGCNFLKSIILCKCVVTIQTRLYTFRRFRKHSISVQLTNKVTKLPTILIPEESFRFRLLDAGGGAWQCRKCLVSIQWEPFRWSTYSDSCIW